MLSSAIDSVNKISPRQLEGTLKVVNFLISLVFARVAFFLAKQMAGVPRVKSALKFTNEGALFVLDCRSTAIRHFDKETERIAESGSFAKYEYPLGDARLPWLHDVKSLRICRVNVNLTEEGTVVQEDAMAAAEDDTALKRGDRKIIMPSVHSRCNDSAVQGKGKKRPFVVFHATNGKDATTSF
ncbi:hypothetical protein CDAR_430401 [Caerostris darwini]|uniref:Uncharacterized protein n=1 Tax=Caerostris darwini TaxID=1538125 RepID=A0AAV4SLB5_9ARAC|nr:hypothetical protein CDAR_430401 [Caerostris darwini]